MKNKEVKNNSIGDTGSHYGDAAKGRKIYTTPGRMASFVLMLLATLLPLLSGAQPDSTHTPDMAGIMRSNGKIYVVVAVLVIILLGLFIYLIRLDRKISRLEKND